MGGGARRVLQFLETSEGMGFCVLSSLKTIAAGRVPSSNALTKLLKSFRMKFFMPWSEHRRDAAMGLRQVSERWKDLLKTSQGLKLVVIDDPIYFSPLVKELRKLNIAIVAMCHNLDSLSPHLVKISARGKFLNRELELLSKFNLVITISREETVLLASRNANVLFFPYYPTNAIIERMLRVRRLRLNFLKQDILLLGTAANIATRTGMKKIIESWREQRLSQVAGKLLVGGYNTERFFNSMESDEQVDFLGTLSDGALDERLASVRAALCYQDHGGGALTRIPELLIAGVPVLANTHAARTYYGMQGVIEFPSLAVLRPTLSRLVPFEEPFAIPNPPDKSALLSQLKAFLA